MADAADPSYPGRCVNSSKTSARTQVRTTLLRVWGIVSSLRASEVVQRVKGALMYLLTLTCIERSLLPVDCHAPPNPANHQS